MKKCLSILVAAVLMLQAAVVLAEPEKKSALEELCGLKIMVGYEDGLMHGEDGVTRAQAAACIMRSAGFDDAKWYRSSVAKFSDVPASHWASGYIYKAASMGVIDGVSPEIFAPEEAVTFEQAVKMILSLLGHDTDGLAYPAEHFRLAEELGLLDGVYAKTKEALSREQLAVLIRNALDTKMADGDGDAATLRSVFNKKMFGEGLEKVRESGVGLSEGASYSGGGGGGASFDMALAPAESVGALEAPKASSAVSAGAVGSADRVSVPLPDMAPIEIMPPDGDMIIQQPETIEPGQLTAGEWKDSENWAFWRRVLGNKEFSQLQRRWELPTDKYEIVVMDGDTPMRDGRVELKNAAGETVWVSRTDKNGKAFVFMEDAADEQQNEFVLEVSAGGNTVTAEHVLLDVERPITVQCAAAETEDILDLMFMIDTTGSMSDELRYINAELRDVVAQIDSNVRISCNYYRDTTDAYTVKPFDFTTNIDSVIEQISMQYAAGGGDYEEAVDLALENAVSEHEWSESARERLLFLVLDAPPHFTPETVEKIQKAVRDASEKGIRIIPVASSGVDKNTEFFLRSLAIATNGTYLFLTDHSGIGNSHLEPTIGDYEVSYLNELILKVIRDYLG